MLYRHLKQLSRLYDLHRSQIANASSRRSQALHVVRMPCFYDLGPGVLPGLLLHLARVLIVPMRSQDTLTTPDSNPRSRSLHGHSERTFLKSVWSCQREYFDDEAQHDAVVTRDLEDRTTFLFALPSPNATCAYPSDGFLCSNVAFLTSSRF